MKSVTAAIAVLIVAALALLALYQAVRFYAQLGRGTRHREGSGDLQSTLLDDEHRRHIAGLREIQFDYETGKIDESDYRDLRRRHEVGAVRARRAMASAGPQQAEPEDGA